MKNNKKAFTLIELLVAIAIVGILAAVVMVSMSSYGAKARSSKALAQLSSVIPSMVSCWGNGGNVFIPTLTGGGSICDMGSSYGSWPDTSSGDLSNYTYGSSNTSGNIPKNAWFVSFESGWSYDKKRVCCNSTMSSCKLQNQVRGGWVGVFDGNCTATDPTN